MMPSSESALVGRCWAEACPASPAQTAATTAAHVAHVPLERLSTESPSRFPGFGTGPAARRFCTPLHAATPENGTAATCDAHGGTFQSFASADIIIGRDAP